MLGNGWNLGTLTRDPHRRTARTLADKGVEIVPEGLEDPSWLIRLARLVYGLLKYGNSTSTKVLNALNRETKKESGSTWPAGHLSLDLHQQSRSF